MRYVSRYFLAVSYVIVYYYFFKGPKVVLGVAVGLFILVTLYYMTADYDENR